MRDFQIIFSACAADGFQAARMADPKDCAGGITAQQELQAPDPAAQAAPGTAGTHYAVTLKCNVAGFIAEDQFAHGGQRAIGRVFAEHAVVSSADKFGEGQDLQFKPHAEQPAAKTKCGEAPVGVDDPTAKAAHGATEQPRMLRFFRKPEVNYLSHLVGAAAEIFAVECYERSRSAAVAEAEFLN